MARLRSVEYEPAGAPSLFDLWESGAPAPLQPPLSVRDARYRARIVQLLDPHRAPGGRLVSVGAGNGFTEAALTSAGWEVLATDLAERALKHCRAKGLATARLDLLEPTAIGGFDAVYCDGVLGHLWEPSNGCTRAWRALAALGRPGAVSVVSNDLADDERSARFDVSSDAEAAFYRPPSGWFGREAASTGRWTIVSQSIYSYPRTGGERRRELLVLLMDERIEAEDLTHPDRGDARS